MTATIWGGAGEHGRSCYLIDYEDVSVLLDCGVKKTGIGEYPQIDPNRIPGLSAVFLSHAHEDHSVAIPLLYTMGYQGEVWTTRATIRQLPAYFRLWREQVRRSGGSVPYEAADADRIRFRCLEDASGPGEWFQATPDIKACWGPSGHLPGAVWMQIDFGGKRVFYSGDYSSESSLLRADLPQLADGVVPDLAIVDAAYGSRSEMQRQELERLIGKVREVWNRRGHAFLPVPLYGRGQELLTLISEALPASSIVCEAALLQGFRDLEAYAEWLRPNALERVRRALNHVTVVNDDDERAAALAEAPRVIFAPDGIMQTPVSQDYYRRISNDSRHAVLFTGHLYEGSFGAEVWRAHADADRSVGETMGRPEILRFRYKIHQGLPDVCRMLERLRPRQTLLVHANKEKTDALSDRLSSMGFTGIHSLLPGERLQA